METTSDRLFYYSKSRDAKPGKGANEYTTDINRYKKLSDVKDWRKILSNFYVDPFKWNGRTWNSVEHAFQSAKIKLVDPVKAEKFTLDSGSELGQGDGLAARMQRKMVFLGPKELKKWDSIKSDVMEDILYAKFTQVPLAAKVLMETGDAELWHSPGRAKAERQFELERVRDRLMLDTPIPKLAKLTRGQKPSPSPPRRSPSRSPSSPKKSPSRSGSKSKSPKSPSRSPSRSPSPKKRKSPPKFLIANSFDEMYEMMGKKSKI